MRWPTVFLVCFLAVLVAVCIVYSVDRHASYSRYALVRPADIKTGGVMFLLDRKTADMWLVRAYHGRKKIVEVESW